MHDLTRRRFLEDSMLATMASLSVSSLASGQELGARLSQADTVKVLNPMDQVPLSFIIDDSTCLVNLAHFCIPQFAEVYPDQYKQDWRKLPREIPDSFVREFADWCNEHGIKGKYSVVPNPACVGWIDRDLPGWTRSELEQSVSLVREELMPNWDIHPEMITHTWVIDTKTGRPYSDRTERSMEIFGWSQDKSADELANYMNYGLNVLKNVGFQCDGITTPGGFASENRVNLAKASLQACRDVFQTEIPHYFRDIFDTGSKSVVPRVELAAGLDSDKPECVVSIAGCTGDWFGGWDGLRVGSADRFITPDGEGGRLPEIIKRGEPTILVCHWPGIFSNGDKSGFKIFQEVVKRVHSRFDNVAWMKLSEIARYWAAKELTALHHQDNQIAFYAPFASPYFTIEIKASPAKTLLYTGANGVTSLKRVNTKAQLETNTWVSTKSGAIACIDLPKGDSFLQLNGAASTQ